MKLYLLFFIGLLFLSCQQPQSPIFYRIANDDIPPEQDIDITFETFDDAWKWVSENIEYKFDEEPYKQTPEETYKKRTGDCEDYAMLLAYFGNSINMDMSILVIKKIGYTYLHCIVECNDIYYEPQTHNKYYKYGDFEVLRVWDYNDAFYSNLPK